MEEVIKALGPWPLIQGMVLGMLVAAAGFWAMRRGMQESRRRESAAEIPQIVKLMLSDDERETQWAFKKQMEHLEKNSFEMTALLQKILEAVNRFNDTRWNRGQ